MGENEKGGADAAAVLKRSKTAERQARFRARKAQAGLVEVRGIFAPMSEHDRIKAVVQKMMDSGPQTVEK